MAIKSNIINQPLKGEINLSKNKLDVVAPNEGGYIKNDGVLYGNVLSPVYRKNGQTAFDYMDADKNHYTFNVSSGTGHLVKNSTNIMEFNATQFKKEKVDVSNIDSLYDETHYIQVFSDRAVIKRGSEVSTLYGTIYATKMIDDETAVVFYSNQSNEYYIRLFYKNNGSYATDYKQITLGTFDLNAPIITSHTYTYNSNDYVAISIITDSGLSLKSHTTFLYAYDKSNPSLKSLGLYSSSGAQQTDKKIEKYLLTAQYSANDYSDNTGSSMKNTQQLWFRGESTSPTLQVKLHWQNTGTKTAAQAWATDIDTSASTEYTVNMVGSNWDALSFKETDVWHHVDNAALAGNVNVKGFLWISLDSVIEWKEEYTQTEINNAQNEIVRFKFLPSATGSVSNAPYRTETLLFPDTYVKYDSNIGANSVAIEETTIISSTSQNCDAILDDGTIIQTQSPFVNDEDVFEQGLFNFTGHFSSISLVGNEYRLTYTVTLSEAILLGQASTAANHKYPYKLVGSSVSLDNNFYRSNLVTEGYPYLDEEEEKKDITSFLFDSGWDNYKSQVLMQAGFESTDNSFKAGSLVQIGKWRLLYNNNLLSGISYSDDETQIGTLVTDWLTVSKILYIGQNEVYYLDNRGLVQHIYIEAENDVDYSIIRDRFIVINTISYNNCWDLKHNTSLHWASDWNDRFFEGFAVPNQLKITENNTKTLEKTEVYDIVSMASAQNANYEMTSRNVSSAVFPPEILKNVSLVKKNILRGNTTEAIDFYRADEGLTVIYDISFKNNVFYKDVSLEGALYPLSDTSSSSILFNPNIFTKFIRTYNNNDMAISDETAYPLQKYNGDIIMLFLMTKGIESMQNIFVLQTLYYGIGDGKIWEIYYDNNTISNYQAIIDVNGMIYLGQLPTEALFWSPLNRSIYSFTGDAILKQLWHCNDISTINETFYNPATQELFISTDIGLLCISNSYTYLLEGMKDVKEMFFYDTEFYIHNVSHPQVGDPEDEYYKVSYEWFENNDTKLNVKTKYFGSIENMKIHINAVYVRLYKDSNDTATFKIKEHTITDKSMSTDWKQCTINWDTDGWGYVRYQPQYQKGSSISFEMESTAPIISISYGYNVLDENGMIGRNNI